MSRRQEGRFLRQLNRGLVATLSLLGMLLDGPQLSDLVLQGAAVIWLWSPELQLVQAACWRQLRLGAHASRTCVCGPRGHKHGDQRSLSAGRRLAGSTP
jgi:hypothetical protein